MLKEHLEALLAEASVKPAADGWQELDAGRHLVLYAAAGGVSLTVNRVTAIRSDGALLRARTQRGEIFVLSLADVFAGAVDAPAEQGRKAGFV
jgi:hypothetical protein